MENEEFKKVVARNLVYFRKLHGYTQLQLAELTHYSDKAISKWERGESLPDIYVLYKLADFYGVTLNDLLVTERKIKLPATRRAKTVITLISFLGVWLLFAVIFLILWLVAPVTESGIHNYYWMCFIYAIPSSFLVSYILSLIWFRDTPVPLFSVSALSWTTGVALHLSLRMIWEYAWLIYIVLIFVQAIIILAYWLTNARKQQRIPIFEWIRNVFQSIKQSIREKYQKVKHSKKKKDRNKLDDSSEE